MDNGERQSSETLVSVNLPPIPRQTLNPLLSQGVSLPALPTRPGTALRLRPPTPPPRPDTTLATFPTRADSGALLFSSLSSGGERVLPALETSPSSPIDQNITLTNPRTVRQQNVYVDTPFKGFSAVEHVPTGSKRPRISLNKHKSTNPTTVITQPLPACKKVALPVPASPSDSIICVECGRCRCASCRSARPLPSAWVCDNSCLCSAETVVDTLSCMCCVKAGLYHCGELLTKDSDTREQTWVDQPCSCSSNKWLLRWCCLAVVSVPLPCLLCYPLLKGVTKLAETCYQSATTQGCSCTADLPPLTSSSSSPASPTDSQKRLLS